MPEDQIGGQVTIGDTLLAAGFVQVPVIVLQQPDLGAGAKLAYGLLLWYAWTKELYPGHKAAAQKFGIAPRSLKRYLSELDKAGLVETQRPGLGKPNHYHLPDPRAKLALLVGHNGPSSGPNRPLPYNESDSVLDSKDGYGDPDSDIELTGTVNDVAAAIGQMDQADQLLKTARKQGYTSDIVRAACEIVLDQMEREDAPEVRNPIALLQDRAKALFEQRRIARAVQETGLANRKRFALAVGNSMLDGAIPWSVEQIRQTLASDYGEEIAAEVIAELQAEEDGREGHTAS